MVSQRPLHLDQNPSFKASHLSCANYTSNQCQAAVKLHGVFSPYHNESAFLPILQFHRDSRRDSHQNHYAIRAGQNLPDKEFRYLRTVIVTAGVHQGLDSELAPLLVTFWHWPSVSPYTYPYGFAETCVFDKQLPDVVSCGFAAHVNTCEEARFIPKLHLLFCRVP